MKLFKKQPGVMAAVDLGSNSFHMIVARAQNGQLHIIDALKETVRLGSGVTAGHGIDPQVSERALACLERFNQRLGDMHPGFVRVVGTNALRRAFRGGDFLTAAENAIGYPIEVISGMEEARLIYTGVSRCLAAARGGMLVIDIGGGSTEAVVGKGYRPLLLESLHTGCLSLSQHGFPDGELNARLFQHTVLMARQEFEPVAAAYRQAGWNQAVGSSGTIRCIADSIAALGVTDGEITPEGLYQLRDRLLAAGNIRDIDLSGVPAERAQVLPGGLAILTAAFESLGIESMQASQCALREGILYELLGSDARQDTRLKTVSNLSKRYAIDMQHASRVESTAVRLYRQVAPAWNLEGERPESRLRRAAQLHEIGLAVSHSRYQLHGGYLIEHSDLPGFNRREQTEIAALIRLHRRKLRLEHLDEFEPEHRQQLLRLAVVLRLAVILHRSRNEANPAPEVTLSADEQSLELRFPDGWLAEHPLTEADLAQEARYQHTVGLQLIVR